MDTLEKKRRKLNVKETKALQKIRSTAEREISRGYKSNRLLIAAIIGIIGVFLAHWTSSDFLIFVFGTISILSFGFVIFIPYETYKDIRKASNKIKQIDGVLRQESIDTKPVKAIRIAVAKEYEDEGDLYIVETADKGTLYLWDHDYNLKNNFPCLEFEIYDEDFYSLIGRQVNPLTERVKPIVIDAKTKWEYLKKEGGPGHLTIETRRFHEVLKQINNVA